MAIARNARFYGCFDPHLGCFAQPAHRFTCPRGLFTKRWFLIAFYTISFTGKRNHMKLLQNINEIIFRTLALAMAFTLSAGCTGSTAQGIRMVANQPSDPAPMTMTGPDNTIRLPLGRRERKSTRLNS